MTLRVKAELPRGGDLFVIHKWDMGRGVKMRPEGDSWYAVTLSPRTPGEAGMFPYRYLYRTNHDAVVRARGARTLDCAKFFAADTCPDSFDDQPPEWQDESEEDPGEALPKPDNEGECPLHIIGVETADRDKQAPKGMVDFSDPAEVRAMFSSSFEKGLLNNADKIFREALERWGLRNKLEKLVQDKVEKELNRRGMGSAAVRVHAAEPDVRPPSATSWLANVSSEYPKDLEALRVHVENRLEKRTSEVHEMIMEDTKLKFKEVREKVNSTTKHLQDETKHRETEVSALSRKLNDLQAEVTGESAKLNARMTKMFPSIRNCKEDLEELQRSIDELRSRHDESQEKLRRLSDDVEALKPPMPLAVQEPVAKPDKPGAAAEPQEAREPTSQAGGPTPTAMLEQQASTDAGVNKSAADDESVNGEDPEVDGGHYEYEPIFPHPEDASVRLITIRIERAIMAKLRSPAKDKKWLLKRQYLKCHPDKLSSDDRQAESAAMLWYREWLKDNKKWYFDQSVA
eukprot:CAMPEP_0170342212 /NCGR_PEP_ID=MMETSP0116_2-20130129/72257_1 /TAXON_ID=400756 /ORGANISM="Durinskia baltica, Strain CSIRO CS-38" /LENGTH=514 /DNA_ID=CAMNT_0010595817 /DNA_START=40 /DNA_END=1584 /DNA_ORIENTATION=-